MSQELDQKIQDVYKRITTERQILLATQTLRQASRNTDVLRKNEAESKEIEKRIKYFEDTLKELQARKQQQADPSRSTSASTGSNTAFGTPTNGGRGASSLPPAYDRAGNVLPSQAQASAQDPARPKQYSNLDLVKYDTPLTPAKISRMLHTLEFKLQVEKQYKVSIDKMTKLYQADGDKKSRAEAESQRVESDRKIHLLEQSMKRYKNLRILDDEDDDDDVGGGPDAKGERKDNLRAKPLSGKLSVSINGARELHHAPIPKSRSSSKASAESTVSLNVEGTQVARTHPSRTDRWNEPFEIPLDKANEVEIVIYDKSGAHELPIGLLWIRISDLVEAQRRQKFGGDASGGWTTAGAIGGNGISNDMNTNAPVMAGMNGPMGIPGAPGNGGPEGITAWFAVQPAGAIHLELEFVKENYRKRPLDAGLGRQGAVRKRRDEVHEKNGHNFIQRQFYQLMRCAFCSDYLLNALGYQCEDCKYTCHKKCFEKVVTKCISKSNTGEDEEKLNHRIPHRFEPLTNMSANWCCHCGYVLPLGRKNARQCSECRITCHANCAHLVPDLCGMSMEVANMLLREMKQIGMKQGKSSGPVKQLTGSSQIHSPTGSMDISAGMDRMSISGGQDYPSRKSTSDPMLSDQRNTATSANRILPPRTTINTEYKTQLPIRGGSTPIDETVSSPVKQHHMGLPSKPIGGTGGVIVSSQHRTSTYDISPVTSIVAPLQPRQSTKKRKVGLDDFNFLAVLGKGNFGKVMLAEEKKTNGLFAIKVLKKDFIIDNDEVESTRSEKRVFLAAARERHPFLLGLHSCFQTETRIYFVMEYVSGGDLMLHIQRKQFSLRQAKFYAAEVLLALQYFHTNGIVYRDLKLDNILLTLDGHVKVADYGLCKEEMWYGGTTSTFCGTPEFMAPEILLEQRYGRAVDWWAFGVLTYEMLLGQSPFRGDDEDEIFDAILEDEPLYPITMPRDAVSILQKLLTRDPVRRLGSGETDAEEIKKQPFFKDVHWDDVFHKRIPPPYFPTIKGSADTSNFDEEFTKEQPTLTPVHGQLSAKDQREFSDFSWVAAWADNA